MAVFLGLSHFSPKFLPGLVVSDDKADLVLSGLAIALVVGIIEESRWTGFAIPALWQVNDGTKGPWPCPGGLRHKPSHNRPKSGNHSRNLL